MKGNHCLFINVIRHHEKGVKNRLSLTSRLVWLVKGGLVRECALHPDNSRNNNLYIIVYVCVYSL